MAEKLTPQQEMAVLNRGGRLLVSAAAGSGKTKVLVDRLMSYLLDPVQPADLDDFLIITYTKAAAAELRGKIADKLSQAMAEHPENKHLQKQMQRLYLAKISTVHSFCGDVLREYAYLVDLPADFRVADENECAQLRIQAMDKVLDEAYDRSDDPDFRAFVDTQGLGRDDRLVPEILMKVYDSARCHLDPEQWLRDCVSNSRLQGVSDASETLWGRYLMQELQDYLQLQIDALSNCADAAVRTDTMEKPAALLRETVAQLRHLRDSATWTDVVLRKDIDYGRMTFSKKCPDLDLVDRIKAVRSACKAGLEKRLKAFSDPNEVVLSDMEDSAAAIRGIVKLVEAFGQAYDRAKRSRRILDFGDLEHKMLDLLLGKSRSGPTAAAMEIGRRFREIMVDEYQDSNAVQDEIFSALTRHRKNCFMVGDVKQSIYQFRLADPTIFLKKYAAYANAEEAEPGEGRKVMLSCNFRSGGGVLASVNDVFENCMSPKVGGLKYGPEESLRVGGDVPHVPLGEPEVELWAIPVEESTYHEEAAFVAQRVAELLDGTHFVREGREQLRPIKPEDIAILLRSPGSMGGYFQDALMAQGIRCSTGGGEDLLQTREVAVFRAILQIISNPRQDIPLLAALASPVFSVTADELAQMRGHHRKGSLYDGVLHSENPKIQKFLKDLSLWRREARLHSLAQLMESILNLTRMDSIFAVMDGGEARKVNIQTFYQLAVDFEKTGRRDLEQFLDHLTALEEKGLVAASEQSRAGTVTIMSIHKSKGLEFPVVFVCGLSRQFNRESTRAQVLCDQCLGLGLGAVDHRNRVRYPSIAKRAIASKITSDSLSEEMRVLYVALTRARDRLIMTYASQTLEKDVTELALRMDMGDRELLTGDVVSMGEWVLMAALRRTEAGELFALGARPRETKPGEPAWLIKIAQAPDMDEPEVLEELPVQQAREPIPDLGEGLTFRYPHIAATQAPSKQTATQRKGREKDAEAEENTPKSKETVRSWRKPADREKFLQGKDVGNATHAFMQYVRYENCGDLSSVQGELERLVRENYITETQGKCVDCDQIHSFFSSQLGKKLRMSKEVLREFKFSILEDGSFYGPELEGEQILFQGVVDCALVEEDGITVIDFKTDYVTEETLLQKAEHYTPQVKAYASALERIFQKPIKESVLYFFRMSRFVSVK